MWLGAVVVGAMGLGLAVLPPFVSPSLRAVLMEGFASVCHQWPGRSPHLHGVQLAVCDRCLGIYAGLLVGAVATRWGRAGWRRIRPWGLLLLLVLVAPAAVDWVGPVVGLWESVPVSRSLTGLVAGMGGGGFVVDRLLASIRSATPSADGE
jgi:uncharacterized membrane protein